MNKHKILYLLLALIFAVMACGSGMPTEAPATGPEVDANIPAASFNILADYNVKIAFENSGVLAYCAANTSITINGVPSRVSTNISYTSSTSLSVANADRAKEYQAYWATSVAFLPNMPNLPDYTAKNYIIVAASEDFGWDPNALLIEDVLRGQATGRVRLGMVNPTQADPSRSFLLAAMTALAKQSMLTTDGLNSLNMSQLKSYFGTTKGATDSVETLIEQVVSDREQRVGKFNAYILDEASLIRINQLLVEKKLKPLMAYYMVNATFGEKFPLALTGEQRYKDAFTAYAKCLHSEQATEMLLAKGYRTNPVGFAIDNPDLSVFNPDWGIRADMPDLPLRDYPRSDVTQLAMVLYQSSLKPEQRSATCFDESGSTHSNGAREQMHGFYEHLESGDVYHKGVFDYVVDQVEASRHGMNAGQNDTNAYMVFSDTVQFQGIATGSDTATFTPILAALKNFDNQGGTPMYDCVVFAINLMTHQDEAFERMAKENQWVFPEYKPQEYIYTVYLMTDGENSGGMSFDNFGLGGDFKSYYANLPEDMRIPVYAVGFGNGVSIEPGSPLYELAALTNGKVIGTSGSLLEALKSMFANY